MEPTSDPKVPDSSSTKKRLSVDLSKDYTDRLDELCATLGYTSLNEAVRRMIDLQMSLVELAKEGYRPAVQHVKTNAVIGIYGNTLSLLAHKSAA